MDIEEADFVVTLDDGSEWSVPVYLIAENRARHYADMDFDGDLSASLKEDTLPLFAADPKEIADWAQNNMSWTEVESHAICVKPARAANPELGWMTGPYRIQTMENDDD